MLLRTELLESSCQLARLADSLLLRAWAVEILDTQPSTRRWTRGRPPSALLEVPLVTHRGRSYFGILCPAGEFMELRVAAALPREWRTSPHLIRLRWTGARPVHDLSLGT